jgi:GAF domain-containing protein
MTSDWEFLVSLQNRLRSLRDAAEIRDTAVRLLGEHLQANRVHYGQIDGDEFVLIGSYANGVSPFPRRGPLAMFGTAVDVLRGGDAIVIADVTTDPRVTDAAATVAGAGHRGARRRPAR